ncbi:LysM peptidoglycan-binding domain-containing protein [Pinibacter soli]|uniref:LysM peptidoglycan-binding domain-containing protein n=1 Tax=Pinibacter soli TaxID=3044211 RepID=A0ABT6RB88_9BACT|nr:LysM peptidoglycan-binding domain-containing protein [Pinibacter soli]MDI3319783.1 LysM peptidoglycan-binding domain-containing protein [Pinibacter soli]
MSIDAGQLEKLYILSYSDPEYNTIAAPPFFALINPETYTYRYRVEFSDTQGQGTSAVSLRFNRIPPQEFNFDFLFDSTNTITNILTPPIPVSDQLEIFRRQIMQYQGEVHRPYYLKIHWGTLLFKGVLTSMDIEFKLFKPDGSPIRAVAKCSFRGSIEETLRVALENPMSPDITHERTVTASDKLPLMTKKIYNDQQYYLDVAAFNGLDSFRNVPTGTKMFFPPLK